MSQESYFDLCVTDPEFEGDDDSSFETVEAVGITIGGMEPFTLDEEEEEEEDFDDEAFDEEEAEDELEWLMQHEECWPEEIRNFDKDQELEEGTEAWNIMSFLSNVPDQTYNPCERHDWNVQYGLEGTPNEKTEELKDMCNKMLSLNEVQFVLFRQSGLDPYRRLIEIARQLQMTALIDRLCRPEGYDQILLRKYYGYERRFGY